MRCLFLIALLCVSSLYVSGLMAKDDITARRIHYNGTQILLEGDVCMHIRMGEVKCQKATIFLQPDTPKEEASQQAKNTLLPLKNINAQKILLHEKVYLKLSDGATLEADDADINCLSCIGIFTAQTPQQVVYTRYLEEEGKKTPIRTKSDSLHITMKKAEQGAGYSISDVQGDGLVSIEYGE